jgi:peptide/nickel transport system substrate-binding protein
MTAYRRLRATCAPLAITVAALGAFASAQAATSVVIAQSTDATSLDPAFRVDSATGNVQWHIFDTMLVRKADMTIGPGLAEAVEQQGADKWSVRLRKGVKFTTGEPLNAEAVKFSLDRILDPKSKAPSKRWWSNFKSITVVDENTVQIVTDGRDPLFSARLTLLAVVPPKHVQQVGDGEFARKPVGTGPYKLVDWKKDDQVVLEANTAYWGAKPTVDKVVFRVVPEEMSRVSALQTGEADVVANVSATQAAFLGSVQGLRIEKAAGARVMAVHFDPDVAPGDNLKFRQAVAHAINRQEIVQGLLKGFAAPLNSVLSSGIPFWPAKEDSSFAFDAAKAKALVAELGLGDKEIVMRTSNARYPYDRETALAVAAQLAKVGLNVKVRPDEWGKFFDDLKNRDMSALYLMGQGNVWTDPYPQLEAFHHSKGFLSTWRDPAIDALLDKSNEATGADRERIFGDALKRIHDTAAAVPLYGQLLLYGVRDRVQWKARPDELIWAPEMVVK